MYGWLQYHELPYTNLFLTSITSLYPNNGIQCTKSLRLQDYQPLTQAVKAPIDILLQVQGQLFQQEQPQVSASVSGILPV